MIDFVDGICKDLFHHRDPLVAPLAIIIAFCLVGSGSISSHAAAPAVSSSPPAGPAESSELEASADLGDPQKAGSPRNIKILTRAVGEVTERVITSREVRINEIGRAHV